LSTTPLPADSSNLLANLPPALEKTVTMLAAIRKMARNCLFNPEDWREYYRGLILYMLGALKFKNLDRLPQAPLPKQLAFWAAATGVHLLHTPPAPQPSRPPAPEGEAATLHHLPRLSRPIQAGGDVIQVGNISGSSVAIGREAQVNHSQQIHQHETIQLFQAIQQHIELHLSEEKKEELNDLVTKIQTEVARAEGANPNKIRRWLRQLIELAPDISRRMVAGLAQPLPGVTPAIRQIAAKANQELDDADEPGI
jgi:transposase-like protein